MLAVDHGVNRLPWVFGDDVALAALDLRQHHSREDWRISVYRHPLRGVIGVQKGPLHPGFSRSTGLTSWRERDVDRGDSGLDSAEHVKRVGAIKAIARDLSFVAEVVRKAIRSPEAAFNYQQTSRCRGSVLIRIVSMRCRRRTKVRGRRDRLRMTRIRPAGARGVRWIL